MSTTAQQVFDIAIGLMDQVGPTGLTDTADTAEYKNRALLILNALQGELYQFSDTRAIATDQEGSPIGGTRPVSVILTAMTDSVDLDDFLTRSVMPYGLAAHLLAVEDPAAASFFQQRFEELLQRYGRAVPAVSQDIENLYGGVEFGRFGRW